MNIFKGLLFLEGYLTAQSLRDDDFGPEYGNRVASGRAFAERFAAAPLDARVPADAPCAAVGCSG